MTAGPLATVPDEGHMEILSAAAQCFLERGFNATSIDDVARRLGSTKGRIYHFHPSKADLFFSVAEFAMALNFAAVQETIASKMRPIEKLRAIALAHSLSMIESKPYQFAVWQGVEIHLRGATTPEQRERLTALIATRDRYSAMFREIMEETRKDGDIDYPDLGVARQLMFMALNSPIFWYKMRPGETAEDRKALARQCANFALKGLGDFHGL